LNYDNVILLKTNILAIWLKKQIKKL
jgi:hypothetical protein